MQYRPVPGADRTVRRPVRRMDHVPDVRVVRGQDGRAQPSSVHPGADDVARRPHGVRATAAQRRHAGCGLLQVRRGLVGRVADGRAPSLPVLIAAGQPGVPHQLPVRPHAPYRVGWTASAPERCRSGRLARETAETVAAGSNTINSRKPDVTRSCLDKICICIRSFLFAVDKSV